MLDFFANPAVLPFSVAFGIMLGLLVIEIIAHLAGGNPLDHFIDAHVDAGFELDAHADVDASADALGGDLHAHGLGNLLAWFHFGRVPVMLILSLLLAGFGTGGIVMQSLADEYLGGFVPMLLAIPAGVIMALAAARLGGSLLARILPRDETSVVSRTQFIGQVASIVQGTARPGLCAEAKLTDAHGQTHYFRVAPANDEAPMPEGTEILLVALEEDYFVAVRAVAPPFATPAP